MLIKRSSLPAPSRGRGAVTTPRVTISGVGQISFNKLTSKAFNGTMHLAAIEWDEVTRKMIFTPINAEKLPKGVSKEDLFDVRTGKGKVDAGIKFIGAAGVLNQLKYDFKKVGSQSYNAIVDEKTNKISFELGDSGKLTPHVPTPRKKKDATGVVPAGVTETAQAASAGVGDTELVPA